MINVAVGRLSLANANLSSLFFPGATITVNFNVVNFVANRGANTDILLPAILTHSYVETSTNGTINSAPRVLIRDVAVGPRAGLTVPGRTFSYAITLNNSMSVQGPVEITIRFPSIFALDINAFTQLRTSGQIISWDVSVTGEVVIIVPQLPAANANIIFRAPFVNFALPSNAAGSTSVNFGSVTVSPVGVTEAAASTATIRLA